MLEEIEARFRVNIARVRALVDLYVERSGAGSGRRPVETVDLLRAAVVFLHATMEDVLRSALEWRWPDTATPELLEGVPLVGQKRGTKIGLPDLLRHRGRTVDELIRDSVEEHVGRSTFNNLGDVKNALRRVDLDPGLVQAHELDLAASMTRRHQIVHRADRHDDRGPGHHATFSLGLRAIQTWIGAIEAMCEMIVAKLEDRSHAP